MRLFVAIDCSELKAHLTGQQKPFYPLKARFTQSFHLTLKFIGDVEQNKLETLVERLILANVKPFTLSVNRLGTFTSYSQKVIWCGVQESNQLNILQSKVCEAIEGEGVIKKAYHPHITLARIKKHQQLERQEKELLNRELKKEIKTESLKVDAFTLYESIITKQGPVYRVIKKYPLGIWRDV
ncbi:RNA 2',3'-cyclic phosphodiesterase [Carboxylicivirga marina]|uniref:RNA 2',3'-cyclic phosphodiesterase n=1 Tax=Carboxylicivirga marina TaxID=2800988 RepID=A0ABS1HKD0_9BACT|nr:RNA 2',3'-cyclic phosphodiesterase [Carboxylicivirga marina]MBK3518123.1 RNA 2',3'-cyclic phosphodiesterase [Carboxylicivirga marina]